MIIYGSRNKELATEHVIDKCPNCGTPNSIDIHVFQKYAHVFWIPIFPLGKTGVSQCGHCKQVLKLKEMPSSLKVSYENVRIQTKTPVWTFAGTAIIVALVIIGIISDKQKDDRNAKLILTPQKGDVFEIKTRDNQYTAFKVESVLGDTVFVQMNNYETNKATGLSDLKKKDYSEIMIGFSKADLKQMFDKGEIIDIERR